MKIHKGDTVFVLSGKDAGKRAKVLRALPKEEMVVVEGVGVFKKHQKPTQTARRTGIIEVTRPTPVSKVQLVCPACEKPTRVGYLIKDGKKVRVCKRCHEEIVHVTT